MSYPFSISESHFQKSTTYPFPESGQVHPATPSTTFKIFIDSTISHLKESWDSDKDSSSSDYEEDQSTSQERFALFEENT